MIRHTKSQLGIPEPIYTTEVTNRSLRCYPFVKSIA